MEKKLGVLSLSMFTLVNRANSYLPLTFDTQRYFSVFVLFLLLHYIVRRICAGHHRNNKITRNERKTGKKLGTEFRGLWRKVCESKRILEFERKEWSLDWNARKFRSSVSYCGQTRKQWRSSEATISRRRRKTKQTENTPNMGGFCNKFSQYKSVYHEKNRDEFSSLSFHYTSEI